MTPEPVPVDDEQFYAAVKQRLADTPRADWSGLVLLLVIVAISSSGAMGAIALIVALVLRDLVRLATMKAVDTFDGRLLVLPLVRGDLPLGTRPGREATVILAGPAFLLLSSVVAFVISRLTGPGIVLKLAHSSVGLAAFTLLPFKPYDGWRLLNLALFSRSVKLEAGVAVLTSLALAGIGIALKAWILTGFAVINAFSALRVLGLGKAADEVRALGLDYEAPATGALPEVPLRALFERTVATFFKTVKPTAAQAPMCAQLMREVHLRVSKRPPTVGVSVLLVTIYGSLFASFVIGLLVLFGLDAPD
jgi:hypothetical protein